MNGVVNIEDLRKLAKKRLPKIAYDFIEGGTDDEVGLVTNEQAFRKARIVPRYLVDITTARAVDHAVRPDLFEPDRHRAHRPRRPVPPRRRPDAGRGGARRQRALHHVGLQHRLDRGSRQARARPRLVSALFRQGQSVSEDMIKRAGDAGLRTLVFTVDVPEGSNRERNARNGWGRPLKLTWKTKFEALRHPPG